MRVLHVEVGGSYGGSLAALENYLAHCDRSLFEHDALLYYPTPGAERLRQLVGKLWTLRERPLGSSQNGRPAGTKWRESLRNSAIGPALLEFHDWVGFIKSLPVSRQLKAIMRAGHYDLVHANNTFTYQLPTLVAGRMARIPVLTHVRGHVRPGPFSRAMARLADCVVTVSRPLEEQLQSWRIGVVVRTCHDGLERQVADPVGTAALRASLAPPDGFLIGSVGRLDRVKGYEDLIRAARIVVDTHPEVRFAIAGCGPLQTSLQRLIVELRLTGRFQLLGFRSDVPNFLAALDLFVSSSLWEGFGLAVAEAMMLGKPVVATRVGGVTDSVIPGKTGTLVAPHDPAALANAILTAVATQGSRSEQIANAQRHVAALCDPVHSAMEFDAICSGVLSAA
jgi:glycosyltransferase involved in cell wall biosynthesis